MQSFDLVIIGGGIAGISAAIEAKEQGIDSILILEREPELGGVLNQCIHSGFGLELFDENLTGPEFSQKFIYKALKLNIAFKLNTTVIELKEDKTVIAVNSQEGIFDVKGKAIIIAVGCVERARGAINIIGRKFAGVYTAGSAQRIVNIEGYLPGKEAVIIGTGDVGLIMARRMLIEGAKVKAVIEKSDVPKGNSKNVAECLEDFNIPLLLRHDVIDINGKARIQEVTVAQIDSEGNAVGGTERVLTCDTILLSVDLTPDNELIRKAQIKIFEGDLFTSSKGIFVCGNAHYIHKDADSIVLEGRRAGVIVSKYILEEKSTI